MFEFFDYLLFVFALDGEHVVDGGHLQLLRPVLGHVQGHLKLVLIVLHLDHLGSEDNLCVKGPYGRVSRNL
jgi:hypothetical protein